MSPYYVRLYVSRKLTDKYDEELTFLVFAQNITAALPKALKKAQREGAIGDLNCKTPIKPVPALLVAATPGAMVEQVVFYYSFDGPNCMAEIHEPEADGLWAQFEVLDPQSEEFWIAIEEGEDLDTLTNWAVKNQKAARAFLKKLDLPEIRASISECDSAAEFIEYVDQL